jgi:hypothetical protein
MLIVGAVVWFFLPSDTFASKPVVKPKVFTQYNASNYSTDIDGNYTGAFDSKILPMMTNSQTNGSFEGFINLGGTQTFFRGKISGIYTGRVYGSVTQEGLSGAIKGNIQSASIAGALEVVVPTTTPTQNQSSQQLDWNVILIIGAILVLVFFAYMIWTNMQQRAYEDYESIEIVDGYVRPLILSNYHREIKSLKGSISIPRDKPKLRKLFYETFDGEIIAAFVFKGKLVDVQFNMTPPRYIKELEEKHAFMRPYDDVNYGQMQKKKAFGRPAQRPLPKISKPGETEYRFNPDQK